MREYRDQREDSKTRERDNTEGANRLKRVTRRDKVKKEQCIIVYLTLSYKHKISNISFQTKQVLWWCFKFQMIQKNKHKI